MEIVNISEKKDYSYFMLTLKLAKTECRYATIKSLTKCFEKYVMKTAGITKNDAEAFIKNEVLSDDKEVPYNIESMDSDFIKATIGVSKAFIDVLNGKEVEIERRKEWLEKSNLNSEEKEKLCPLVYTSTFQLGKSVFNKITKAYDNGLGKTKYLSKGNCGGYSYYKIDKHWWYCVGDNEFANDTGYVTKKELNKLLNNHC